MKLPGKVHSILITLQSNDQAGSTGCHAEFGLPRHNLHQPRPDQGSGGSPSRMRSASHTKVIEVIIECLLRWSDADWKTSVTPISSHSGYHKHVVAICSSSSILVWCWDLQVYSTSASVSVCTGVNRYTVSNGSNECANFCSSSTRFWGCLAIIINTSHSDIILCLLPASRLSLPSQKTYVIFTIYYAVL